MACILQEPLNGDSKLRAKCVSIVEIFGLVRKMISQLFHLSAGAKERLWRHTKASSTCSYKIAVCLKMVVVCVKIVIDTT